jgi:hypothetical protein
MSTSYSSFDDINMHILNAIESNNPQRIVEVSTSNVKLTYDYFLAALANGKAKSAYQIWSLHPKEQWDNDLLNDVGESNYSLIPLKLLARFCDFKLLKMWYEYIGVYQLDDLNSAIQTGEYDIPNEDNIIEYLFRDYPMIIYVILTRNIIGLITLVKLIGNQLENFLYIYPLIYYEWLEGIITLQRVIPEFQLHKDDIPRYYSLISQRKDYFIRHWLDVKYGVGKEHDIETFMKNISIFNAIRADSRLMITQLFDAGVDFNYPTFISALANGKVNAAYEMWKCSVDTNPVNNWGGLMQVNEVEYPHEYTQTPLMLMGRYADEKLIYLWYEHFGQKLFSSDLAPDTYLEFIDTQFQILTYVIIAHNKNALVELVKLTKMLVQPLFYIYPLIKYGWLDGLLKLIDTIPGFKVDNIDIIDIYYPLAADHNMVLIETWLHDIYVPSG